MAATKQKNRKRRKSGSRRRRRNTTTARSASTAVAPRRNPSRRRSAAVQNRKRRGTRRRRNPGRSYLSPAGLPLAGLLAAGLSAAVTQALSSAIPIGTPGSLLGLAKDGALVFAVHKFWPRSFYNQWATAGAAAIPVANVIKPWVSGGLGSLTSKIQSLLPSAVVAAPVVTTPAVNVY